MLLAGDNLIYDHLPIRRPYLGRCISQQPAQDTPRVRIMEVLRILHGDGRERGVVHSASLGGLCHLGDPRLVRLTVVKYPDDLFVRSASLFPQVSAALRLSGLVGDAAVRAEPRDCYP